MRYSPRFYLFITFLIFNTVIVSAQYDSSALIYLKKARAFLNQNSDSARLYVKTALQKAKSSNYKSLIADSYNVFGEWHYHKSDMEVSRLYYDSAFTLYTELKDDIGRAEVLSNQSFLVQKGGNIEMAVDLLLQCQKIYQEYNRPHKLAQVNASLGNSYFRLRAYDKAKEKYLANLKLFQQSDESSDTDIGGIYLALGGAYKALVQYDSSEYYYRLAQSTLPKDNLLAMSFFYNNIASLFHLQDKLDSAESNYIKSINIKKDLGHIRGYVGSIKNLSEVLLAKNDKEKALEYLEYANQEVAATQDSFLIRDVYFDLAEIYYQTGNYSKSNEFYRQFIKLEQRLSGLEKTQSIAEIEEKYENEKNQTRIAELELRNQQALNQRNLIIFGALTLGLIAIFLYFQAYQRKKTSRLLTEKNHQISQALGEKETLLKEIHHRVKNNLQVVSSLLNLQANTLTDDAAEAIKEGQMRVKSMALIHQKLYQENDLMGIEVQGYLENLLAELLASFNQSDEISYQIDANHLKLDVDTMVPIGLIINELITNSLKYAFEKSAEGILTINMQEEDTKLKVTVTDNGKGMSSGEASSQSFGWKMIKSLCRQLKADVSVESINGTEVTLMITRYKLI